MKYLLIIITLLFIGCSQTVEVVLWSGGEVPYCYADDFTATERITIGKAMTAWEKIFCIRRM